jgi:hypothetical protein
MMITKLLAVAALASAVVVRDAAEFRAELARGTPSIELADNLYLEGEELNVTAPCVVDGRGNGLLQAPGVRLFRASAALELRDITLSHVASACRPTPPAEPLGDVANERSLRRDVGPCGRQRPLIIIQLDENPQHASAASHRDTKVKGPAAPRSGRACATPSPAGS